MADVEDACLISMCQGDEAMGTSKVSCKCEKENIR